MTSTFATKYEIFDVNVANLLLSEDDSVISTSEKKQLSQSMRKLKKGNLMEVTYSYARGFENLKVGRVYSDGSQSIGCMSTNRIRVPMAKDHYHDIDVVNCHYTIAYQYAKKRNLPHEHIQFYVENREAVLSDIMDRYKIDRTDAKIALLKIAYGGYAPECIPDYNSSFDKDNLYDELSGIKEEVDKLSDFIWTDKKEWQKLRLRKDNHCLAQSGPNKKFKMLALFLQTEERIILECMDKYFTSIGRSVDVLIHDGCMIRKGENEDDFPNTLLEECEKYIFENTNYSVKLTEKKMVMDWEFSNKKVNKSGDEFWKTHFLMNGKLYKESNLYDTPKEVPNAKNYVMKYYTDFNCKPEDVWKIICSKPRREYDMFGFYPYGSNIPSDRIYNTFQGHPWTDLFGHKGLMTNYEYTNLVQKLKNTPLTEQEKNDWDNSKTKWQIEEIFCYHDDQDIKQYNIKYYINILGNILFNTPKLCEKALCLRNKTGGSGKSGFMEKHYAGKLLGEAYFTSQSSSNQIFGQFNASIYNKLLILCEEFETQDTKNFTSIIKASITRSRNEIRLMRTDPFPVTNYVTYIANTNKQVAFEFDSENYRRFPLIDCKEYRLTKEDKQQLQNETNDQYYNKLLLLYILHIYDPNFNYECMPKSDTLTNLKETLKPSFFIFMDIILFNWDTYYEEKYGYLKRDGLNFHKRLEIKLKAELFCDIYKEVCKNNISPEYALKIKFASFRQSEELKMYMAQYPTLFYRETIDYIKKKEESDISEVGTYYTIKLEKLRKELRGKN